MATPRRIVVSTTPEFSKVDPVICLRNIFVLGAISILSQVAILFGFSSAITFLGMVALSFYGISYNLRVLRQMDRRYCVENYYYVQKFLATLPIVRRALTELGMQLISFVDNYYTLVKGFIGGNRPENVPPKENERNEVKTPDILQMIQDSESVNKKSNSEPARESCRSSQEQVKTKISSKLRFRTSKTPELFKNKIYQTRRTLINAQNELFNDKIYMF